MRYANYKKMVEKLGEAKEHLLAAEKAYAWTLHELVLLEDNPGWALMRRSDCCGRYSGGSGKR